MSTYGIFRLTALRANGTPVVDASVRILDAGRHDVTILFFTGVSGYPKTDASGQLEKFFVINGGALPTGQTYFIQVVALGFQLWETSTSTSFNGKGNFTANLLRSTSATGPYEIETPPVSHLSALHPIDIKGYSPTTGLDWELLKFKIDHSDGRTSTLETPVVDGVAQVDLQSRVRLHPRPNLVPDGQVALVDPDFSDRLEVSYSSISIEGPQTINGGFLFGAANMQPPGKDNDLSSYVYGTIRWITLLPEPVVFRGYYSDVLLWLIEEGAEYVLHTKYFNGANVMVGTEETEPLTGNPKVQRIRLNADPASTVKSAQLWVTNGEDVVSQTLTVRYRD
ncbi:hypothetical protein GCM10028807_32560 [Spirosoma daeguense]